MKMVTRNKSCHKKKIKIVEMEKSSAKKPPEPEGCMNK